MRNAETVLGIIQDRGREPGSWATLESWVLRKAHAQFGGGGWKSADIGNSPAAYSTRSRRGRPSRPQPAVGMPSIRRSPS